MTWETRHRARGARPARHQHQDVLRLRANAYRRAAQHARLIPYMPRAARARCRCPTPRRSGSARAAALALGCTVHPVSIFARKNYFYPDLPKGYQISQFDRPLATGGSGRASSRRSAGRISIGVTRLHLEEDAGKSLHDRLPGRTAVDLNRAGVPLAEIVSEPDMRSRRRGARLPHAAASSCWSTPACQRLQHGEGHPAGRRQRLGPAGRATRSSAPRRR